MRNRLRLQCLPMAQQQTSSLLVDSPLVRVFDVICRTPRSGCGPTMLNRVPQFGLPRRGVFVTERQGRPVVVDTRTMLLLGPNEEYRVAHPTDDGDVGIVFAVAPALLEDAIG